MLSTRSTLGKPAPQPLSLRQVRSLLRRTRELGPRALLLFARTFALLLAARLALAVIPVRVVIAWKRRPVSRPAATDLATEAARIRNAVLTVARYSPVPFVCFPQCLAAAALLRARGIPSRLHYGVARSSEPGGKLVTHTWLEAAGQIVIGGEVADAYSTLAVY